VKLTQNISLNVYITFYQDISNDLKTKRRRIRQLADLVLNLAYLDIKKLDLKVFTNVDSEALRNSLAPLNTYVTTLRSASVICVPPSFLINQEGHFEPHLMTWGHKETMRKDLSLADEDTYFLYLEDDAIFTIANLEYFIHHREVLRKLGLIPSFLRAEWSDIHETWINSDSFERITQESPDDLKIHDGVFYREMKNPYCALILFDYELANEYFKSGSSELEIAKSRHPFIWDTAATAALGLIAEKVPLGRNSRTVIGFSRESTSPLIGSVIRHQGDRYANEIWWRHFRLFENYELSDLPQPKRNLFQKVKRLRSEWRVLLIRYRNK
jgi:hypothetical protein